MPIDLQTDGVRDTMRPELDRYTRYPEERRAGDDQSMSTEELKSIEELILRIRDDLGVDLFHYPLHSVLYRSQGAYPKFDDLDPFATSYRVKFALQTFYPRLYQSLLELPTKVQPQALFGREAGENLDEAEEPSSSPS